MNPTTTPVVIVEPVFQRPFQLHPTKMLKGWRYKNAQTGEWAMATNEAEVTHARMFSQVVFEPCYLFLGQYVDGPECFWWFFMEEDVLNHANVAQLVEMARQNVVVHTGPMAYSVVKMIPLPASFKPVSLQDLRNN